MRNYINQNNLWVLGIIIWAILYFHYHISFWWSILDAAVLYFLVGLVWGMLAGWFEEIDIMKK